MKTSSSSPSSIFAVFVAAIDPQGMVAATTRCADRGEDASSLGLPGGKVDQGENPRDAAIREAAEEGWEFQAVEEQPYFVATVEGKTVAWFRGYHPRRLSEYKEQKRLLNVWASREDFLKRADVRFRNAEALERF